MPLHIPRHMDKVIAWWGKGIFVSLCVSIVLLGTGPLDSSLPRVSVSAWSVSRTTFFIWLIWRLLIWVRYGSSQLGFPRHAVPIPLLLFFAFVTLSLLPDFHRVADYRYFFLGAMHYLMILDFCSDQKRWRLIFHLLALLPGLLAVRGILYDPLVLELDQMRRFELSIAPSQYCRLPFRHDPPALLGNSSRRKRKDACAFASFRWRPVVGADPYIFEGLLARVVGVDLFLWRHAEALERNLGHFDACRASPRSRDTTTGAPVHPG